MEPTVLASTTTWLVDPPTLATFDVTMGMEGSGDFYVACIAVSNASGTDAEVAPGLIIALNAFDLLTGFVDANGNRIWIYTNTGNISPLPNPTYAQTTYQGSTALMGIQVISCLGVNNSISNSIPFRYGLDSYTTGSAFIAGTGTIVSAIYNASNSPFVLPIQFLFAQVVSGSIAPPETVNPIDISSNGNYWLGSAYLTDSGYVPRGAINWEVLSTGASVGQWIMVDLASQSATPPIYNPKHNNFYDSIIPLPLLNGNIK